MKLETAKRLIHFMEDQLGKDAPASFDMLDDALWRLAIRTGHVHPLSTLLEVFGDDDYGGYCKFIKSKYEDESSYNIVHHWMVEELVWFSNLHVEPIDESTNKKSLRAMKPCVPYETKYYEDKPERQGAGSGDDKLRLSSLYGSVGGSEV